MSSSDLQTRVDHHLMKVMAGAHVSSGPVHEYLVPIDEHDNPVPPENCVDWKWMSLDTIRKRFPMATVSLLPF